MVRKYVSKGTRKVYTPESLAAAILLVQEKGKSIRYAANLLGIQESYLFRAIKKKKASLLSVDVGGESTDGSMHTPEGPSISGLGLRKAGHKVALSKEVETDLANHLKTMAKWGFALGKQALLDVVKEYVDANGLDVPFKNGRPGSDWFTNFCKRTKLSLKNLEGLEKSRRVVTGDPFVIYKFYDLLESTIDELQLQDKPNLIYNLDETSFSSDPSKVKLISGIGQKAHRHIEGSGRENTTVLACVSASGTILPPLIIFQAANLWSTWKGDRDLPGTFYSCSENGWMTSVIFQDWFQKFCETVTERPLLIIFDGHLTHLDLGTVTLAKQNNVTIIKLPAHTTDLLQPLDRACFKSLKYTWDLKLTEWVRENQRKLKKDEFVDLLCSVWNEGLKKENVIAGFRSIGIFPPDRTKYPTSRFEPEKLARYLELQAENVIQNQMAGNGRLMPQQEHAGPSSATPAIMPMASSSQLSSAPDRPTPTTPTSLQNTLCEPSTTTPRSSPSFETILLSKIKKTEPSKVCRRKISTEAKVITSQEYLDELMKKESGKDKRLVKKRPAKKSESPTNNTNKSQQPKSTKKKKAKKDSVPSTSSSDESEPKYDNSDGSDWMEEVEETELMETNINDLMKGKFLLVQFKGGKRNCTTYKYVCIVEDIDTDDAEIKVTGLKCMDFSRLNFTVEEKDCCFIDFDQILGTLPEPTIQMKGERMYYKFLKPVAVFERA